MRLRSLYPLTVLSVLLTLSACSGDDSASSQREEPGSTGRTKVEEDPHPESDSLPVVLFLGDSIAAGYGVEPEEAFPAIIQHKIDEEGWQFEVLNAGVSGDTSAGGLARIDWLLDYPAAVLVIELGGNDGLRGLPPEVTRRNLESIIERARERYPDVRIVLAGMQMPPNMGESYTDQFRRLYPDISEANDAVLIPFLLDGVGGDPVLNQPDGIHPTARGHAIIADTVWDYLRPILGDIHNRPAE